MPTDQKMTQFARGLRIGQAWRAHTENESCRVVAIDPALGMVEVERLDGRVERGTIDQFVRDHEVSSPET